MSRRVLGLRRHPVVLHRHQQVAQQRVHAPRIAPEDAGPIDGGKPVGQVLGPREIADL
jgi:hypothetical protein